MKVKREATLRVFVFFAYFKMAFQVNLTQDALESLPKYVSIELPLLVKSPSIAVDRLGGEDLLRISLQSAAKTLHLSLSSNALSPPIAGSLQGTCGLLLRVFRSKRTGAVRVTVMGSVSQSYQFNAPADFLVAFPSLRSFAPLIQL